MFNYNVNFENTEFFHFPKLRDQNAIFKILNF